MGFSYQTKSGWSIDRYKEQLVTKGFHQHPGCDYTETFSPVVKPVTLRIVLTLAVRQGWSLCQLDVNNAFLQGTLKEEVFMLQPHVFVNKNFPEHICRLKKALYRLKQAPRAWYTELREFLLSLRFVNSTVDASYSSTKNQALNYTVLSIFGYQSIDWF